MSHIQYISGLLAVVAYIKRWSKGRSWCSVVMPTGTSTAQPVVSYICAYVRTHTISLWSNIHRLTYTLKVCPYIYSSIHTYCSYIHTPYPYCPVQCAPMVSMYMCTSDRKTLRILTLLVCHHSPSSWQDGECRSKRRGQETCETSLCS